MKEDQKNEWKELWRDDFLKVLCGFANAEGGTLVIGRSDDGEAKGVPHAAKLLEDLPNTAPNPGIAGAFFRAGEIEAWGRGIQRIFGACKEAGTPVPRIEWDGGDLWFEFPYSRKYLDEVSAAVGQEGGLGEKLGEKLGENRLRILRLMNADPTVSSKKISNSVGISLTAVDKNISLLKDRGFIRRIGPAKGGHWEVIRKNQC